MGTAETLGMLRMLYGIGGTYSYYYNNPGAEFRAQEEEYFRNHRTPIHMYEVNGVHYEVYEKEGN